MAEKGKYLTSFLEIYIDTDESLTKIDCLKPELQGTYYHEYLHYIQDVTTCSGISKIWNSFDRFRQLVAYVQSPEMVDVQIPLEGDIIDEQKASIEFFKELRGSGQFSGVDPILADTYRINNVEFQEDHRIATYFPESNGKKVRLHLESKGLPDKVFTFGEAAISETMAYILERKFFPELNILPRYPYLVAYHLVEFLHSDLLNNEENLFALCDVALMHNMPGWAFVEILKKLKTNKFVPKSGNEIIEFGYHFYEIKGWDFAAYMRTADKALQHISEQLFRNQHFEPIKKLFQASIERGRLLRENSPFGILDIYRGDIPLSYSFYKVFNFLGGPHSVNKIGHSFVRVPEGLETMANVVYPQHFRVIWQLNKLLIEGERSCSLYNMCKNMCTVTENKVLVDDRCEHNPWRRSEDEFGCPYAAHWVLYGFQEKDFYLNGVIVQQRTK